MSTELASNLDSPRFHAAFGLTTQIEHHLFPSIGYMDASRTDQKLEVLFDAPRSVLSSVSYLTHLCISLLLCLCNEDIIAMTHAGRSLARFAPSTECGSAS